MSETITVSMPAEKDDSGTFTLFLRAKLTGALLNAGGDVLTRVENPRELLGRFTFAEVVAAIRTDDEAAIYAVANLQTTVAPIDLGSDETRTLVGALVVAKIITAERLAEILS